MLLSCLFLSTVALASADISASLCNAIEECLPETKFYSLTLMMSNGATMDDLNLSDFAKQFETLKQKYINYAERYLTSFQTNKLFYISFYLYIKFRQLGNAS